jgi:L,D-transpeptidase catalytic domain
VDLCALSITYNHKLFFMRWIMLSILAIAGISTFALLNKTAPIKNRVTLKKIDPRLKSDENLAELKRLNIFGKSLKAYARVHNYNTRFSFLVDMKLPSGRNRFFIYDMQKDSVLAAGLVAHGSGKNYSGEVEFSNEPNSYCTSPGRYRIGVSYNGRFGLAYKLHGLDATNSNAYSRAVVLHSHSCVPDYETAPYEICQSWGCPTVSPSFLNKLKNYLSNTDKPMLLWVVN